MVKQKTSKSVSGLMAGGVLPTADLANTQLMRRDQVARIDLEGVLSGRVADFADVELQANDALVIPKLDDQYQVVGEVMKPGPLTLKLAKTILTALGLAGGPTPTADLAACTILRGGQSIPVDLEAIIEDKDYTDNVELQAGDTLVLARRMERVFVFGQVARPGAYPYTARETLMDILAKAGGIGPQARLDRIWLIRATQPKPLETATAPAPAKPRQRREVTSTPWLAERHWGYEVQQPAERAERGTSKAPARHQQGTSKAPAPAPPAAKPRERFALIELAKLPQGSPEAKPRDGDLIYVPTTGERGQNVLTSWFMNLLPGWLLYRN